MRNKIRIIIETILVRKIKLKFCRLFQTIRQTSFLKIEKNRKFQEISRLFRIPAAFHTVFVLSQIFVHTDMTYYDV